QHRRELTDAEDVTFLQQLEDVFATLVGDHLLAFVRFCSVRGRCGARTSFLAVPPAPAAPVPALSGRRGGRRGAGPGSGCGGPGAAARPRFAENGAHPGIHITSKEIRNRRKYLFRSLPAWGNEKLTAFSPGRRYPLTSNPVRNRKPQTPRGGPTPAPHRLPADTVRRCRG